MPESFVLAVQIRLVIVECRPIRNLEELREVLHEDPALSTTDGWIVDMNADQRWCYCHTAHLATCIQGMIPSEFRHDI